MRPSRRAVLTLPVLVLTCVFGSDAVAEEATVRRVMDGDTIELTDGRLVRYIGVDAPEVRRRARPGDPEWRFGEEEPWVVDPEPFGQAATEANIRFVNRKRVRLEYDVQTHDRFGRLLAYVHVAPDGGAEVMVNAELLRAGVAQPLTIPPNVKYAERFRALVEEARQARRGLWGGGED